MTYDYVDVLTLQEKQMTNSIIPEESCTVYVQQELFDADLLLGLQTIEHARKQLNTDAPRSIFKYNGQRFLKIPDNIPTKIIRYCTQCVMGLPVTILFETFKTLYNTTHPLICESGAPMFIFADVNGNVNVMKTLFIRTNTGEILHVVHIQIIRSENCMIEIQFCFDR